MRVVDEKGFRSLYFDNRMVYSRILLAYPLWLCLPCYRHILACLLFNGAPRRVLEIGLGGGSLTKFFLNYFPSCYLEAVDSDPEMAGVAHQFFFLPKNHRLKTYCADGEAFVTSRQNTASRYDLILVDAFDHEGMSRSVYVRKFFLETKVLLSRSGVIAINTNRIEEDLYKTILDVIAACFPGQAFRLPVPQSNNEMIFCCNRQESAWRDRAEQQRQALAWLDHPGLDFFDYLNRMVPLQSSQEPVASNLV